MERKSSHIEATSVIVVIGLVFIILLSSGALASGAAPRRSTEKARIAVYSDSACTGRINSISWGNLSAGTMINKTVYVKNIGTATLTLNMSTTNLKPTDAGDYITCFWNREGATISPKQTSSAVITLYVSPTTSANVSFSMNILVAGIPTNQK